MARHGHHGHHRDAQLATRDADEVESVTAHDVVHESGPSAEAAEPVRSPASTSTSTPTPTQEGKVSMPNDTDANTAQVQATDANAPSEDEIRQAQDVLARAKAAGVSLKKGGSNGVGGAARIMLPNGELRIAFIRRLWTQDKLPRGEILKRIKAFAGHEGTTYQIVFSATKGVDGGPQGGEPAAAANEAGNEQEQEQVQPESVAAE